jgi:hypothetical protein
MKNIDAQAMLDKHCSQLMEHFDCVQILVTNENK